MRIAYEQLLAKTAGTYSYGDSITHADIVLYAQIILSERSVSHHLQEVEDQNHVES